MFLTLPIEEAVVRLIARMTGISREKVTPTSRLFHDLGIYGDDAGELLTAFAEEFGVDLVGFEFSDYFCGEPRDSVFWQLVTGKWVRGEKLPLTVGDLVKAARVGALQPILFNRRQTP